MSTSAGHTDEMLKHSARSAADTTKPGVSVTVSNLRPVWLFGTEDVVIDHDLGWAYVSSQVYQSRAKLKPQGAIYGLDLEQRNPQPINLTAPLLDLDARPHDADRQSLLRPNGAFHPHGLSFYSEKNGEKRLFVINHDDDEHTRVEIFAVAGPKLTHLRTVSDDTHLPSPNDLLAVGLQEFYLSNDHGFRVQPLKTVEDVLHLQRGTVVYFDGQEFTQVAGGIAYANGLALSSDGRTLYVAAMHAKKLLAYSRNPEAPAAPLAAPRESVELPRGPDNLEWDADGALWMGAQCDISKIMPYFLGQVASAPSMILRIADPAAEQASVDVVWEDDGQFLSAASVAAVYRRRDGRRLLLIGAPFDDRMLIGELT